MGDLARHTGIAKAEELTQTEGGAPSVARTGRTDAVNAGLVRKADAVADAEKKGVSSGSRSVRDVLGRAISHADGQESADAGDQAARNVSRQTGTALQSHANMRSKIAALAAGEMDEADETQGTQKAYAHGADARNLVKRAKAARDPQAARSATTRKRSVKTAGARTSKRGGGKGTEATAKEKKDSMQSRRTWIRAHAAREKAAQAGAQAAAKEAGTKTFAAFASSALAPLSGVIAGIIAFVLAMMLVSQLMSVLFGFWENESTKQAVAGLPPYITREMVVTALECQEVYGHPAGCTLAQIICESGQGDHLSGLATQDNNLFGIKWAQSYGLAAEVSGHSSWQTGEEVDGQSVTIMAEFTSFKSCRDCIVFRSRVFLQNTRYSQNALIQEAMVSCDSDKMAEGLKDAGYATSSSYVERLKAIMQTYNLYRFDGMSAAQFEALGESSDAIVAAAMSQLGVPYAWGGTTPGVGLDCSGLTQYCYAQAGIAIPRQSEDQKAGGTTILLSEAQPGDILWRMGHVAIYLGGDSYIHEPQTGDVCKISTGIDYFTCAVRYR